MAEQISERLLAALDPPDVSNRKPVDIAANLKQWNEDIEKDLLSITPGLKFKDENLSASFSLLKVAGNKLHFSLLLALGYSVICEEGWSTDKEAGEASLKAVDEVPALVDSKKDDINYFTLLAELLRAAGLFMRWNGTLQSNEGYDTANNPTTRLKSEGMLSVCLKLIDIEDVGNKFPDVARFASICLFRATYGNDESTIRARKTLVDSLDGCRFLMKALLKGDQPLSRIFSVVRNVHHLILAYPSSIVKMNTAIEQLTMDTPLENGAKHDLLEVLVATMSWAFRSDESFPGDITDRRSELVLEILRALFALDAGLSSKSRYAHGTMTQLGILLCELLKLPSSDARVYECKLTVVSLLLSAPSEYAVYLADNGAIQPLVEIMAHQLALVVIERTGSSTEDAAAVVPILLVLQKLAQANSTAFKIVKEAVFPPEAEKVFQDKVQAEMGNQSNGTVKAKNMAPLDAPKGTIRWKLIRLMTWTDSNVKRAGCELLWTLCGDDPTQFVLRTGFGNAVHFLGIKGCVSLPAGV